MRQLTLYRRRERDLVAYQHVPQDAEDGLRVPLLQGRAVVIDSAFKCIDFRFERHVTPRAHHAILVVLPQHIRAPLPRHRLRVHHERPVLLACPLDRLLGLVRDGQHADARLAFVLGLE